MKLTNCTEHKVRKDSLNAQIMPAVVFSLIYFTTVSCFSHVRSETLLSFQKSSSQTITSLGRDSSKAVDGNCNADWYAGSCTLSNMVHSWWKVDLEASHLIGRIDIYPLEQPEGESDGVGR